MVVQLQINTVHRKCWAYINVHIIATWICLLILTHAWRRQVTDDVPFILSRLDSISLLMFCSHQYIQGYRELEHMDWGLPLVHRVPIKCWWAYITYNANSPSLYVQVLISTGWKLLAPIANHSECVQDSYALDYMNQSVLAREWDP